MTTPDDAHTDRFPGWRWEHGGDKHEPSPDCPRCQAHDLPTEGHDDVVQAITDHLTREIHEAWEFQYDQCDHGTYGGGPGHGQPYEMCRLSAERIIRRRLDAGLLITGPGLQAHAAEQVAANVRRNTADSVTSAISEGRLDGTDAAAVGAAIRAASAEEFTAALRPGTTAGTAEPLVRTVNRLLSLYDRTDTFGVHEFADELAAAGYALIEHVKPTADSVAQAIADPGSVVGMRREGESVARWSTRAVLELWPGKTEAEIEARTLREHHRRVFRFMPSGMVNRATVLADLEDYASRVDARATPRGQS